MIKKILISILIFIAGFIIAFWTEEPLSQLIRNLIVYFSDGNIQFIGKYVHFPSNYYCLSFSGMLVFSFINKHKSTAGQSILLLLIEVILFFSVLTTICMFSAISLIAECTACTDNTRRISYWEIDYTLIILFSVVFSMLPSTIAFIRRIMKTKQSVTSNE